MTAKELDERARRLSNHVLELVDIRSESRSEAKLTEHIEEHMARFDAFSLAARVEDCLFYLPDLRVSRPLVVFAGHTDTVPEQGNFPGRIEGGAIFGLGACDMKGGLGVMLELVRWLADEDPRLGLDAGFLFFGREELPVDDSALPAFFDECRSIRDADLIVMMEPTGNAVQAGCVGNVNARLTYHGESAHSARPWLGVNAITEAVEHLRHLVRLEPLPVTVEGLEFTEVLSVTQIEGGIAANVIPDRLSCNVNYRYPPNLSPAEAEGRLRRFIGDGPDVEVINNSRAARPFAGHPLVERLRAAGPCPLEAKQAWTPVAEFAACGLAAVNFGPGDEQLAHRADEHISMYALASCLETLQRFLSAPE